MKTILAFAAHPDDIEFGCGGIIIKEIQKGNKVKVICMTKGEAGSAGTPEIREQEARNAANIMGSDIEFMDFGGDCHIENNVENKIRIARKIREEQPDIILTLSPFVNQHPDHYAVSHMTRDACRLARYGGLKELKDLKPHIIRGLYYYSPTPFRTEPPDIIIDISDVHEQWNEAMKAHETQVKNKNYIGLQNAKAQYLGIISGMEYGMGLWKNDTLVLQSISEIQKHSRNF